MTTIDILRNRFTTIIEIVEKMEKIKRIPSTITNHINNIHDEFAEYDAMLLDKDADDVVIGISHQIKYLNEIIYDLEYMIDKLYNKNI